MKLVKHLSDLSAISYICAQVDVHFPCPSVRLFLFYFGSLVFCVYLFAVNVEFAFVKRVSRRKRFAMCSLLHKSAVSVLSSRCSTTAPHDIVVGSQNKLQAFVAGLNFIPRIRT